MRRAPPRRVGPTSTIPYKRVLGWPLMTIDREMSCMRFWFALLAALTLALPAAAQSGPTRIRGTIASVDGDTLTILGRDGQRQAVVLDRDLTVSTVKPLRMADIKPGSFVGTATRRLPDGSLEALEVLVFPEEMRGAGEGHRPWDLEPGSMMTNGTVTGAVESADDREVTVTYKDGSQTVRVPSDTPVVTLAPADRADLKPKAPVFLSATPGSDGKLHAARITVGRHGIAPPM